jgi:thiamine-phosphate pyrophosphorylase
MTLPTCRLFLVTPGSGDPSVWTDCLRAALAAGDVASLLITPTEQPAIMRTAAELLLPVAQAGDVAVLIEGNTDLVRSLDADGLEVGPDLKSYRQARLDLGSDVAVGAFCGADRHRAMELAEAGADYVRLDPFCAGPGDETLIAWWAQLFEVPCVAAGPLTADDIRKVAASGADFVQPDDRMWVSPAAADEVIAGAVKAIADATQ